MELIDDIVYEVNCKMVPEGGIQVNIGANPSAEGEENEECDDSVQMVNNIVTAFRLQETSFDKKSYMAYIRDYMKRLKKHLEETNPDRVPVFEKGVATFVKKVLEKMDDWQFFQGESFSPEGMVVLMGYREDGMTPFMVYFKDGLKGEKY